jgi:two-component system sensor histidine kinase/response regulator
MNRFGASDIPGILIVDDAPANLELLAEMLRTRGYEPRPVTSGAQALATAQADPPDLILLDVRMPEMDGFEVCARLKADERLKEIPVIFITALTETEDKVKAFSLGAVDYLSKPFQVEEVEARVRTHLRVQSLQNQLRAHNKTLEQRVAEKTRQLAVAYQRLLELGRLKDDFLGLISFEIRTSMYNVLGIGDLIIDLCPTSKDSARYADLFHEGGLRLRNLIEDATLIAEAEKLSLKDGSVTTFSKLLTRVQAALPEIKLSMDSIPANGLETFFLQGEQTLLRRALEAVIRLASGFSRNKYEVHGSAAVEARVLRVRFEVDALELPGEVLTRFFEIETYTRIASSLEALGLSPVVAYKIISAFGGELKLVKSEGNRGYLEATLLRQPDDRPQA